MSNLAILVPKLNSTWDREVGIDPTVLALSTSNIKLQVVDIEVSNVTAPDDPAENTDKVEYDQPNDDSAGYRYTNLRKLTGFGTILGLVPINGKIGAHFTYDEASDTIRQYSDAGAEEQTGVANALFPMRFLVIGV